MYRFDQARGPVGQLISLPLKKLDGVELPPLLLRLRRALVQPVRLRTEVRMSEEKPTPGSPVRFEDTRACAARSQNFCRGRARTPCVPLGSDSPGTWSNCRTGEHRSLTGSAARNESLSLHPWPPLPRPPWPWQFDCRAVGQPARHASADDPPGLGSGRARQLCHVD